MIFKEENNSLEYWVVVLVNNSDHKMLTKFNKNCLLRTLHSSRYIYSTL